MVETPDQENVGGWTHDEFNDLVRRVGSIQDMVAHPGWPLLKDAVNEKRASMQERLAFGGAANWEDYVRDSAFLQGIEYVLKMPDKLQVAVNTARAQRAEDRAEGENNG